MRKTWLVFDMDHVAHVAYHAIKSISWEQVKDNVLFGVFQRIQKLQTLHNTNNLIFCFDHGTPLRKTLLPTYKATRAKRKEEMDIEDKKCYLQLREQILFLRTKYLRQIGFNNIVSQDGYEADDMIASVVKSLPDDEILIVSGDNDLYQLLSNRVSMVRGSAKPFYTKQDFMEEYNVNPCYWPQVKAYAGDDVDDIDGVAGVGKITACKYIRGMLPAHNKLYQRLECVESKLLMARNLNLVTLPYPGVKSFVAKADTACASSWREVMEELNVPQLAMVG